MPTRIEARDTATLDSAASGRAWGRLAGVLGLALWMLWCTRVAQMPELGFRLSANQIAWLLTLPLLGMATLRVLGAMLPPVLAGSHWTLWGLALMLPLATAVGQATERPDTAFEWLVLLALACGLAAGAFAAAWVPASAGLAQQSRVLQRRGLVRLCAAVAGGFGGALGLDGVLPWLAVMWWPQGVRSAWLGAVVVLLGWAGVAAAVRRWGPRRAARWAFATAGFAWLVLAQPGASSATRALALAVLLPAAGAAAGASLALAGGAVEVAGADRAAALGFATAVGAFGAFVVPKLLGASIAATGGPAAALAVLAGTQFACWLAVPSATSDAAASSRNT